MAADKKQPQPEDLYVSPSNVLGIIQRSLWELSHYISQPVDYVDPRAVMGTLHEVAKWTSSLPVPAGVANGDGKGVQAAEARAN